MVIAAPIRLTTMWIENMIKSDNATYLANPAFRSRRDLLNNIHPISEILQFRSRDLCLVDVILAYLSVLDLDDVIDHVLDRTVC